MIKYSECCYVLLKHRIVNSDLTEHGCPRCKILWSYTLNGVESSYHNRGNVFRNEIL